MDKVPVIVTYPVAIAPNEANPTGRLAGETYEVSNVGAALEHYPDAEIVLFLYGPGRKEPTNTATAKRKWQRFLKADESADDEKASEESGGTNGASNTPGMSEVKGDGKTPSGDPSDKK